jgi:hypothetical protein
MQSVSNGVEPETTPGGAPFLRQAALSLSCNLSQTGLQQRCVSTQTQTCLLMRTPKMRCESSKEGGNERGSNFPLLATSLKIRARLYTYVKRTNLIGFGEAFVPSRADRRHSDTSSPTRRVRVRLRLGL